VPATPAPRKTVRNEFVYGKSPASRELLRLIRLVAPTDYNVIIYGESGSGKEAVAQMIHKSSRRARFPFVAMDCGAISKDLAGSELYGHEKGSFTGALATKIGHFESAMGGTIFLDEVGNLPYDVQSSLLRVVQERKIKRIGSLREISIDVRIIVASNENLMEAHKSGKFREDLFHRFNEFQLNVPALRDRQEDLLMYAHHFLEMANEELGRSILGFTPEVERQFQQYPWLGNLREMKNVIRRAALLTEADRIGSSCLPFEISNFNRTASALPAEADPEQEDRVEAPLPAADPKNASDNLKTVALAAEYELIRKVLKEVNYNKSKAAQILKIDRKTLYNKINSFEQETG
jgi:two-component system response regulator HydG